ncbi:MAG: CBS domain-containing protein [Oleibacter sp.]|nr:CBS domain-containing protein [Thalassolituus sp.]
MTKLKLYPVFNVDELVYPEFARDLTVESNAAFFFTDFKNTAPLVIDYRVSAVDALNTMIKTHVRMNIVVDESGNFLGIVTANDLTEQNIIKHSQDRSLLREELDVTDMMARKKDLLALNIEQVQKCSIGDVVSFLKDNAQQHCLVVDETTHQIRGVFSASDISRKLKLDINIHEKSSFYRVFAAVS